MNTRLLHSQFNKQGFTLIELLVVIGLLSILVVGLAAAINPLQKFKQARDTKRLVHLKSIAQALDEYYITYGQYPSTGGTWYSHCNAWGVGGNKDTTGANGWIPNLAPTYLKTLPLDPERGENRASLTNRSAPGGTGVSIFCYVYNSNGTDYKVAAHCGAENRTYPSGDPFYKGPSVWGCGDWHLGIYTSGAANW